MAGDWIKMRTSLLTNPKVNGIARALEDSREVSKALSTGFNGGMSEIVTRNVMRHVTVSSLLIVWGAANEHTQDGVFKSADLSDIDDMVGIPGFGEAMESVGWAEYDPEANTVTLPNFNEYNTSGSSRSANAKSAAQRQKEYRERKKSQESDVTRDVTSDVTRNRREEKRREEISPSLRSGDSAASRGSRLPDGWTLPDDWAVFCKAERPDLVPNEVAERFADYWHSAAGAKGRKSDWFATWRNWVRAEKKTAPAASETVYQRSMRERMQEAAPSIAKKAPSASTNVIDFFEVEAKKLEDGHGPAIALG